MEPDLNAARNVIAEAFMSVGVGRQVAEDAARQAIDALSRILGDPHRVCDAAQMVAVAIGRNRTQIANPVHWAARVASNTALGMLRRTKSRQAEEGYFEQEVDPRPGPNEEAETAELVTLILDAPKSRNMEVALLRSGRDGEDRVPVRVLAEMYGVSAGHVSRMCQAGQQEWIDYLGQRGYAYECRTSGSLDLNHDPER